MALTVPALPAELFSIILGINTKQIKKDKLESHLKTRGKPSTISEPEVDGSVKVILEGRQYRMSDEGELTDPQLNWYGDVNNDGTVDWCEDIPHVCYTGSQVHRDEVEDLDLSEFDIHDDDQPEINEEESEEEEDSEEYEFEFEGVKYKALGDDVIDDEYNYYGEFDPFTETI